MTATENAKSPDSGQARTLAEVQVALAMIRPRMAAPCEEWLVYHQRSAAWYAEIAEIDRGHHHESLYLAELERQRVQEVAEQIQAGASTGDSGDREEDC
ncbi:MAG: AMED_5909 family protein [Pseudonocardiaceae bacterium]